MTRDSRDPILREARRRMTRAAGLIRRATRELEDVARNLERHRNTQASLRAIAAKRPARERVSLAWWYYEGLVSILDDVPLGDAAACIVTELAAPSRQLKEFVRDEEETLARRAARRAA
jgi:hypothetical protein